LKTNAAIFVWNGTSSITEEQQVAVKMAEFLKVFVGCWCVQKLLQVIV
jgi:hypothetical protein